MVEPPAVRQRRQRRQQRQRRVPSRPDCWPCRRRRIACDRETFCRGCRERGHPDLCSYDCRETRRRSTLKPEDMLGEKSGLVQVRREMRDLQAHLRTMKQVSPFINDATGDQHELRRTPEAGQKTACSVRYEDNPPCFTTNFSAVDACTGPARDCFSALSSMQPAQSVEAPFDVAGSSDDLMLYTSRPVPTDSTPSLTHCYAFGGRVAAPSAAAVGVWTTTLGAAGGGMTDSYVPPCQYESAYSSQGQHVPEVAPAFVEATPVSYPRTFAVTTSLTFDEPLITDLNCDLIGASESTTHPPSVLPGWRSPRTQPPVLQRCEPVVLPDSSSHAPSGFMLSAPSDSELSCRSSLMSAASLPYLLYSGEASCPVAPAGASTSDQLAIRFTPHMYNTLDRLSTPLTSNTASVHQCKTSRYKRISFIPWQFSPHQCDITES